MTHISATKYRYEAKFPDGETFIIKRSSIPNYGFAWRLKDPHTGETLEKGFSKTRQNADKSARAYVNLLRPKGASKRSPWAKEEWRKMSKEEREAYTKRTNDLFNSIEIIPVEKTEV